MLASILQINYLFFPSWIVTTFRLNISPHKSSAYCGTNIYIYIYCFFPLRNSIDASVLRVANIDVSVFKVKDLFTTTKYLINFLL